MGRGTRELSREPVSNVGWRHRDGLTPNGYNPNRVAPAELELLIVSIIEDGFTQPLVVLPDGVIIDGFHRHHAAADPRLMERYDGMLPTVVVDVGPVHRQMSTIRHNRARGQHGVTPMAAIVRSMVDDGVEREEIQRRLGMEDEEVARLLDRSGSPVRAGGGFGKSWKPTDDKGTKA